MIGPSDIQIILGKVRPLSRPLTEAHPQVLIIALSIPRCGRGFARQLHWSAGDPSLRRAPPTGSAIQS
ncbi:MAG: hypothetical protein E6R06_14995 [Mycobacterium sp.]|nr:MAG: hypothetical protein E6R06_14995 [Mycobacterium sp.]